MRKKRKRHDTPPPPDEVKTKIKPVVWDFNTYEIIYWAGFFFVVLYSVLVDAPCHVFENSGLGNSGGVSFFSAFVYPRSRLCF